MHLQKHRHLTSASDSCVGKFCHDVLMTFAQTRFRVAKIKYTKPTIFCQTAPIPVCDKYSLTSPTAALVYLNSTVSLETAVIALAAVEKSISRRLRNTERGHRLSRQLIKMRQINLTAKWARGFSGSSCDNRGNISCHPEAHAFAIGYL